MMLQSQNQVPSSTVKQENITLIYSPCHRNEIGSGYNIQMSEPMQVTACRRDNELAIKHEHKNKALQCEPNAQYFQSGSDRDNESTPVTLLVSPQICFNNIGPSQGLANCYPLPMNQPQMDRKETENVYIFSSIQDKDKLCHRQEMSAATSAESSKKSNECRIKKNRDNQITSLGLNDRNSTLKFCSGETENQNKNNVDSVKSQNDSNIIRSLRLENESLRRRVENLESCLYQLMPNESYKKEFILHLERVLNFVKKNKNIQNEENNTSSAYTSYIELEAENNNICLSTTPEVSNAVAKIQNNNSKIKQQLISTNNINMSINQQPCIIIPNNGTPPILASNLAQIHLNTKCLSNQKTFNEETNANAYAKKYSNEMERFPINTCQFYVSERKDTSSPNEKEKAEIYQIENECVNTPMMREENKMHQQIRCNSNLHSNYATKISVDMEPSLSVPTYSLGQIDEIEINKSSGIFLPRQLINQFKEQARDSPTHYMRKLLSIFFDQHTFAISSARGKGITRALNPRYTAAVWSHTLQEYPTCSMTTLVEDTNRRCAEARRTINRQSENKKYQTIRHRRNSNSLSQKNLSISKGCKDSHLIGIPNKQESVGKILTQSHEQLHNNVSKNSSSSSEEESPVIAFKPVCIKFDGSDSINNSFSPQSVHEENQIIPVHSLRSIP